MRVAAASTELLQAIVAAGHRGVALDADEPDALLLAGPDAWELLRAKRRDGVVVGAIVYTHGPPPLDRPLLEPVLLLRDLAELGGCLESLGRSGIPGRLRLPMGTVDLERGLFHHDDGRTLRLSTQELRLLGYLGARAGQEVDRDELQLQVWDHSRPVPTRSVDMAISRLRAKIELEPTRPTSLLTIRHVGYRLVVEDDEEGVQDGLVGRGREIGAICTALAEGVVCVCGPPGIGKSRVAGFAAASIGAPLYVALDGVEAFDVAVSSLALAARIPIETGDAATLLPRILGALPPQMVVVWDDADGVPGLLERLVGTGRALQIVTRRASSSAVPCVAIGPLSTLQTLRMLELRTGAAAGLKRVAEALEGVPLAVELAAARLASLGPEGLEHALQAPLQVLTGPDRSMRAAIEASWVRLSPAAQGLLAAVAGFRGTFTTQQALGLAPTALAAWLELIELNLVVRAEERFRVLHAVRAFALERVPQDPLRVVRTLRADLVAWTAALDGPTGVQAHRSLAWHVADLRAAHESLVESGRDPGLLADVTVALNRELLHHASVGDRTPVLERSLAVLSEPRHRARILAERGELRSKHDRPGSLQDYDEASRATTGDPAARAALEASQVSHFIVGTTEALRRVRAIELEGATPATRLRVQHAELKLAEVVGEVPIGTNLAAMASIADELVALGAIADAVYVGIDVGEWKRAMADPGAVRHLERVLGWARLLHSPVKQGQLKVTMAGVLGMTGEPARALQLLDEATILFETVQPMRVFQIQAARAGVQFNAGLLDDARAGLLENAAWGRRNGIEYNVLNAALLLTSLEIEAGNPEAATAWAAEALQSCQASGNDHLVACGHLAVAHAAWANGDPAGCAAALADVAWSALSDISKLQWISLAATRDPSRVEAARAQIQLAHTGRREALHELVDAAQARDPGRIDALLERDGLRFGLDHRILVRIWRSIALRSP